MKTFATTRPVTRPAESGSPAKPVRVLIVAPSLDILGGQAIQATRLIEGFREEPSLKVGFLPHNPRLKGIFRVAQSIKYVRTLVTSSLYFVLLLINVPRYDVIHIFSASYYSYLLCAMPAIIVARLFGRPSILNYRSGEAEDHLTRWPATAVPTMRLADKIVVPSGYLVDTFRRFGLGAESISNAVDTEVFSYHPRNPLRPVFLSGRNLEPLYNVACVLRAFDLIQRRFPGARLIIAGDGSCRESLEKLASELRLKNTEFIGAVEPDRMNVLYDSADIYLNSSNIDNMPASILEAFACGLPVVTTNAGGIPYIVSHEETGLMVECDDFMAMAASAIRLLEDQPFATRLAKNALNECAKYTWSRIRDLWVNLYAQMSVDAHIKANRQAEPNIDGFEEAREPRTRILIVAPSMNILGGQSIQAGHLHSMLKGAPNLSVRLLPINPTLPSPFNLLQRIKYLRTLATSSFFCYSLIRHLRRYDIVHVFSASYFSFVLSPTPAMLVARLYRKKIVLNYHSGEAEDHLKTWRRTAVRTMRLADRIVVPSAFLVDVFNEFSLPATAIFNTVDTDVFAFRERLPLRPVFLSNRNLEPLYNVGCILRAFSIIQQAHPDARLVVAGAGKERRALERLALALRLKQTTFTGRVEPDRMRELYDCADIYLNSSNIDNMPGSILESFACGLPVVTTNAGGIPYIVRHEETGLMVDRNDHQALAAAAMRLLKDRELARKIILNARAECHKYQWSSVRNQWIDLYADIVGGSSTVASASTAPPALAQAATATVNHQTYLKESAGQGVRQ